MTQNEITYWENELKKVDFEDKTMSFVDKFRPYQMLYNYAILNLELMLKEQRDDALYGWVFIKGIDGNWAAARRDDYYELFNGDKGNVFKSKHIEDLESLITKGEGDVGKMLKLIK